MNRSLLIAFVLVIAAFGAYASSGKAISASLSEQKSDFIPNRCVIGGAIPVDDDILIAGENFAACVCFWNGTCEFRTDKSRDDWCYNEGAASVNEGERCPNLKGNLLYICPQNVLYPMPVVDPLIPVATPVVDPTPIVDPIPFPPASTAILSTPSGSSTEVLSSNPPDAPYVTSENPAETSSVTSEESSEIPMVISTDPIAVVSTDPVPSVAASKQKVLSKSQIVLTSLSERITSKFSTAKGCVCTADGCNRAKVIDWSTSCEDSQVIAVVETGPCPEASPCKLRAPQNSYKCQKSDRGTGKICPLFITLYGCICHQNGTCISQSANSCIDCQNSDVVSVSTGSQCDCV